MGACTNLLRLQHGQGCEGKVAHLEDTQQHGPSQMLRLLRALDFLTHVTRESRRSTLTDR